MERNEPLVFAVKHKNDIVRKFSRSGGIFTALSDDILSQNGVVYGCVLTNELDAKHVRAETLSERDKMRGSKYIQSEKGSVFKDIVKDLENGRKILFSGTSCEIAALKSYIDVLSLNELAEKQLVCVDIVCHGVPSPAIWHDYISFLEKKYHGHCVGVEFRNKSDFGWKAHIETLTFQFLVFRHRLHYDIFKTLFYNHQILRPCCYSCPYKNIFHPGDITIGDYWGIEKAAPSFNDDKGVSLVLINNEKGKRFFEKIKKELVYQETRLADSLQPPLIGPFPEPENRSLFWDTYQKNGFKCIVYQYGCSPSLFGRLKNRMRIHYKYLKHKISVIVKS